ncbi:MAG: hypothetical protein HOV68_05345 [Streptomycetaceae bacterium]|nr:hypothetical protein [Streptomycetaceae bacterium]
MTEQPWQDRFDQLLAGGHADSGDPVDAGAQLVVSAADGTEVFRHGLARHHRTDSEDPQLIWIRPLVGGAAAPDGTYVFNLSLTRRRSLRWTAAQLDTSGSVQLRLSSGETALIQPAEGEELAEVQRWDRFTDLLTRDEEAALDELDGDSWHGRYA